MKTRRLILNRETVRSLDDAELQDVNGMSGNTCYCSAKLPCTLSCNPAGCQAPTEFTC